jgi:hypothetical protein
MLCRFPFVGFGCGGNALKGRFKLEIQPACPLIILWLPCKAFFSHLGSSIEDDWIVWIRCLENPCCKVLREKRYPVESLADILSRAVPLKFMFRRNDRTILSRAGLRPSFMKIITDFLQIAESVLRNSFSVMEKFPRFYCTRSFSTMFTTAGPRNLSSSVTSRFWYIMYLIFIWTLV